MSNDEHVVRDLDHLIEIRNQGNLHLSLCDAWGKKFDINPIQAIDQMSPYNWFWRNRILIGIGFFFPYVYLIIDPSWLHDDFFWMVFPPALVCVFVGQIILSKKPPKVLLRERLKPFADALSQFMRASELSFSQIGAMQHQAVLSHTQEKIIKRCRLILEFQKMHADEPPSHAMDVMAQDLRRELADVYDSAKVFGLVDTGGYGRYYEIAKGELAVA